LTCSIHNTLVFNNKREIRHFKEGNYVTTSRHFDESRLKIAPTTTKTQDID
jgi:hypothetical protein